MGQTASGAPWSESVEGTAQGGTRRARLRLTELEGLESRTLLATIPAATAAGGPQNLSSLVGNVGGTGASQNSSTVAIDPTDPTKLVTVWIDNDPTMAAATDNEFQIVLEAAYSINGGQSWLPLLGEPVNAIDPARSIRRCWTRRRPARRSPIST